MHTRTTIHVRAAASLALLLLAGSAIGRVYRCEDGAGNVTFSDKWCAEVSHEVALESDGRSAKASNESVEAKYAQRKRMNAVEVASEAKAQERKRACELDRSSNRCDGTP